MRPSVPVNPGLARTLPGGYISIMCGRVIQSSGPLRYAMVDGMSVRDGRVHNYPPRWNGAPSQELLVIRRNHKTGEVSLDPLRWGLIPYWCQDPTGGRKPINAKCETVHSLPTFREAYRNRRCILPVDGFFEWKAIKGKKGQAAVCHRDEGRRALWHRRYMGELEAAGFRRMDSHVCDYHHRRQRARRPDS